MSSDEKWSEFPIDTTFTNDANSFLSFIDLDVVSTDDQNRTILATNARIYFQETLVTSVDAATNDITNLGLLSFDSADEMFITDALGTMLFDVDSGGAYAFQINDLDVLDFDGTDLNVNNQNITNTGNILMNGSTSGTITLAVPAAASQRQRRCTTSISAKSRWRRRWATVTASS